MSSNLNKLLLSKQISEHFLEQLNLIGKFHQLYKAIKCFCDWLKGAKLWVAFVMVDYKGNYSIFFTKCLRWNVSEVKVSSWIWRDDQKCVLTFSLTLRSGSSKVATTAGASTTEKSTSTKPSQDERRLNLDEELFKALRKHFRNDADTKKVVAAFKRVTFSLSYWWRRE